MTEPIKDIIPTVIQNISERKPNKYEILQHAWEKVLPKADLKYTVLDGIKEGCLVALVDSPARLFYMNMKKRKILEELKKEIPDLEKILFKIGKTQ